MKLTQFDIANAVPDEARVRRLTNIIWALPDWPKHFLGDADNQAQTAAVTQTP